MGTVRFRQCTPGRRIVTLVGRLLDEGAHAVRWSGTDERESPVASGIYLYRLPAVQPNGRDFICTKKMMFLK